MSTEKYTTIHVIYGSCSGNVEWFCEQVNEKLKFETELHRAENTKVSLLKRNKLFIY